MCTVCMGLGPEGSSQVAPYFHGPTASVHSRWETPEEMATHSRILTWEISWTEEPGGLQFMGSQGLDTIEPLSM